MLAFTNLGLILLAIYLILVGITGLVPSLAIPPLVLAILALVSGILLLLRR